MELQGHLDNCFELDYCNCAKYNCVWVHVGVGVQMCARLHARVCVCIYIYIYVCVCLCVYDMYLPACLSLMCIHSTGASM